MDYPVHQFLCLLGSGYRSPLLDIGLSKLSPNISVLYNPISASYVDPRPSRPEEVQHYFFQQAISPPGYVHSSSHRSYDTRDREECTECTTTSSCWFYGLLYRHAFAISQIIFFLIISHRETLSIAFSYAWFFLLLFIKGKYEFT